MSAPIKVVPVTKNGDGENQDSNDDQGCGLQLALRRLSAVRSIAPLFKTGHRYILFEQYPPALGESKSKPLTTKDTKAHDGTLGLAQGGATPFDSCASLRAGSVPHNQGFLGITMSPRRLAARPSAVGLLSTGQNSVYPKAPNNSGRRP